MNKISVRVISILLLTVMGIVAIAINQHYKDIATTHPPTLVFPIESNVYFTKEIGNDINLNSGITMERALSSDESGLKNITFAVFNHTNESITFANQGFGLRLFWYDDSKNQWMELRLRHFPDPTIKTLPPKLETWDLTIQNIWDVLENDLDELPHQQIRLYVSGTGDDTQIIYGAYLDVIIPP